MKRADRNAAYCYAKQSTYLSGFDTSSQEVEAVFADFIEGKIDESELEKRVLALVTMDNAGAPTKKENGTYLGPNDRFDGMRLIGSYKPKP